MTPVDAHAATAAAERAVRRRRLSAASAGCAAAAAAAAHRRRATRTRSASAAAAAVRAAAATSTATCAAAAAAAAGRSIQRTALGPRRLSGTFQGRNYVAEGSHQKFTVHRCQAFEVTALAVLQKQTHRHSHPKKTDYILDTRTNEIYARLEERPASPDRLGPAERAWAALDIPE